MPLIDSLSAGLDQLRSAQRPDGGWGFQSGGISWTEPTCLAILALRGSPSGGSLQRALDWLRRNRRADGGWSPEPRVPETTWVTAMGVLALASAGELRPDDAALGWLVRTGGAEAGWAHRLRTWMLGQEPASASEGWPWYPGAAAWVGPTAMAVLAAEAAAAVASTEALGKRLESARAFLLERRCADGGWNHGSSRALGYDTDSYPETTGMALLALAGRGIAEAEVFAKARETAWRHLTATRSLEGWCWLQMGLRAHRIEPPKVEPPQAAGRQTREIALYILTRSMMEGNNPWKFDTVRPA